jgi:hypothetical protein
MATFAEAAEKKRALSGQVSSLTRTLSLGVLAVTWLFLSGSKDPPALVAVVPKWIMLIIAATCVVALALDLLQYLAAYKQVSADYVAAKTSKAKEVIYYADDVRQWAFTWKVWLAISASFALVVVLSWAAINTPEKQACAAVSAPAPLQDQ